MAKAHIAPNPRNPWTWFPGGHERDTCEFALIGVEGYSSVGGGSSGGVQVAFTIVDNVEPFRELRQVRPVPVARALALREQLIAQIRLGHIRRSSGAKAGRPYTGRPGRPPKVRLDTSD